MGQINRMKKKLTFGTLETQGDAMIAFAKKLTY